MGTAKSWHEVDEYFVEVEEKARKIPPPPQPDDAWSEKLSALNRTLEGMREQLNGRMEMEE